MLSFIFLLFYLQANRNRHKNRLFINYLGTYGRTNGQCRGFVLASLRGQKCKTHHRYTCHFQLSSISRCTLSRKQQLTKGRFSIVVMSLSKRQTCLLWFFAMRTFRDSTASLSTSRKHVIYCSAANLTLRARFVSISEQHSRHVALLQHRYSQADSHVTLFCACCWRKSGWRYFTLTFLVAWNIEGCVAGLMWTS